MGKTEQDKYGTIKSLRKTTIKGISMLEDQICCGGVMHICRCSFDSNQASKQHVHTSQDIESLFFLFFFFLSLLALPSCIYIACNSMQRDYNRGTRGGPSPVIDQIRSLRKLILSRYGPLLSILLAHKARSKSSFSSLFLFPNLFFLRSSVMLCL